jgi:hypothetical protein
MERRVCEDLPYFKGSNWDGENWQVFAFRLGGETDLEFTQLPGSA